MNCDQTVKKSTKKRRVVVGHPRQITTVDNITSISNWDTEIKYKEITTDDVSSLTSNWNNRLFNEVPKFIYDTEKLFYVFSKNAHCENRKEPAYLVWQALCNSKSAYKHISTDDVNLNILLETLKFSLTASQRIGFSFILRLIDEKGIDINDVYHEHTDN